MHIHIIKILIYINKSKINLKEKKKGGVIRERKEILPAFFW